MAVSKGDLELGFHRFLKDTKDDFFPDPLNYRDLKLKQEEIVSSIKSELDRILGARTVAYSPHHFLEGDTPKGHHVVRHTIALHPFDRIVYSYIVTVLAPLLETNLSEAQYSHKLNSSKSKYIFGKRPIKQWLSFRSDVKKIIDADPEYKYIVSTDIAGYFEYIHIMDFKKQINGLLSRKTKKATKTIELLNQFLKCFSPSHHSSVPQGYDASSYLASAFLNFFDKDLEAQRIKHFRYVDDIRIVCKTLGEAKKNIVDTIHSLRKVNLNLSTIKTKIWRTDGKEFKQFYKKFPKVLDDADAAVNKKSKKAIDDVLQKLNNGAKKLLKERKKEFDERLFRAYIWRIVKCHWFKNINKVNLDYIGKFCIKLLIEMPGRTDSFLRFLVLHKDRKYVQDGLEKILSNSVYPWQKMRLWHLLILVDRLKNNNLLPIARAFVRDPSKSENSKNFALIFLGKHGDYNDRCYISTLFRPSTNFFNKRCILVAIQEYTDRNVTYNQVLTTSTELALKSLVEYLRSLSTPEYLYFDKRIGEDEVFIS